MCILDIVGEEYGSGTYRVEGFGVKLDWRGGSDLGMLRRLGFRICAGF